MTMPEQRRAAPPPMMATLDSKDQFADMSDVMTLGF